MRAQTLSLPLPKSGGVRPSRPRGPAPRVFADIVSLAIALFLIAPLELNRPWLKRHVQDLVRSASGLDVDYGWARLHVLSGEVVWTQGGRVVERDCARGLGAAATAEPGRSGWRVRATAGSADAPLDLHVTRERDDSPLGAGRAELSFAADMTASALSAAWDLNVLEQSFVPSVEAGDWHVEASARFDPAAGLTTITIDRLGAERGRSS